MKTRGIATLCLLLLAGVLAGCGGPASLRVRGVAPLNMNEAGESTPVEVRIYLLRDDKKFLTAQFDQLWTADDNALGGDKIGDPKVVTVRPMAETDPPVQVDLGTLPSDARFVGVMALYPKTDPKGDRLKSVPASDAGGKIFEFTGYRIQLK